MNKHHLKKIGWLGGVIIIFVIALLTYFNRSYAYIYQKIDQARLKSPDKTRVYLIENNMNIGSQTAKTSLTYAALGDSLTAGVGVDDYRESYPYLLAQYFAGNDYQITLKDRAVPGAKTKDLLSGLLPGTIDDDPDIVTVLIGVNDIHGEISQEDFKDNYDNILKRLASETKAKIYVINIPLIGANNLLLPPYNYLFDARTKEYNKIIQELALKYNVKYIDLYTPTESLFKTNGSHYAADFFHPSAEGYKIWADLIYASLN